MLNIKYTFIDGCVPNNANLLTDELRMIDCYKHMKLINNIIIYGIQFKIMRRIKTE